MIKSCTESGDCPGMWECDMISETCVRTEPANFYWYFIASAGLTLAASILVVVLLSTKKKKAV